MVKQSAQGAGGIRAVSHLCFCSRDPLGDVDNGPSLIQRKAYHEFVRFSQLLSRYSGWHIALYIPIILNCLTVKHYSGGKKMRYKKFIFPKE